MSDETKKCMTPAQYWEWRCTIEEVKTAAINEKRVAQHAKILQYEIELNKLKLKLHTKEQEIAKLNRQKCEEDYKSLTSKIESELEVSLKDCVIDEYSYEVKKVSES